MASRRNALSQAAFQPSAKLAGLTLLGGLCVDIGHVGRARGDLARADFPQDAIA